MAEQKYKVDTKSKLTKIAEDLGKVLGTRRPPPAATATRAEVPPKKPSEGESATAKPEEKPST